MSKTTKRQRTGEQQRGRRGQPVSPPARFEKVFEKIYRLVLRIPRGRVMTYGQIARLLEERYSPRLVGWAMHATPHDDRNIPWHRVINSRGGVSTGRVILAEPERQQLMLEAEGVVFDARGYCDLRVYQWSPRQRAAATRLKLFKKTNKLASRTRKRTANGNNSRKAKANTPKVRN